MELPWVLLALAGTGAATGLALLPYVPRVPPAALPGKLTATTFALERPCCIFDRHANASDTVWLAVAFANASATFRNPPSRADVPLYESLPTTHSYMPTTHSYMTLETAAAAYACSAPSPAILRVGGDTACGGQGSRDPCNGPLPSPGPYRVKFLVMGCHGPKAETRWSDPILLRRAGSPSTIDPAPVRRGSDVVVIASILASLGAALAAAVLGAVGTEVWGSLCHRDSGTGASARSSYRTHHIPPALPQPLPPGCRCSPPGLGCFPPPASCSASCQVNSLFTSVAASSLPGRGTMPSLRLPPRSRTSLVHQAPAVGHAGLELWKMGAPGPPKATRGLSLVAFGVGGAHAGTSGVCGEPRGGHRPGVALSAPSPA
ncbi:uroplakin-3b-like [Theristicus caerulescens]